MNSDVYKMRKFKNCSNIIFTQLVKRKNSGWLERIRKYGDLGENFPSNSNGYFFFGMRKSNGIELYQS